FDGGWQCTPRRAVRRGGGRRSASCPAGPLRGIIEELLLGDALAAPALQRELLHLRVRPVRPLEAEPPVHDDMIAIHEHRPQAARLYPLGARQHGAIVGDERVASAPRLAL